MKDTIELLEAIGRDASLRHASPEELAKTLEQAAVTDALKAAVAAGDGAPLSEEFGDRHQVSNQSSQGTWRKEDEDEDDKQDQEDDVVPTETE